MHQGSAQVPGDVTDNMNLQKNKSSSTSSESSSSDALRSLSEGRSTDSARLARFFKELSGQTVVLGMFSGAGWPHVMFLHNINSFDTFILFHLVN